MRGKKLCDVGLINVRLYLCICALGESKPTILYYRCSLEPQELNKRRQGQPLAEHDSVQRWSAAASATTCRRVDCSWRPE
jgi:hypothetical protein